MLVRKPAAVAEAMGVARFIWDHPANRGRRVRQLARAMTFQTRARMLHQRSQAPVGQSGRIWVDLHRTGATKALYANPPDWPEMAVWQARLGRGDLFVDVGANVGTYTVLAASLGAEVIALEPASDTATLLRENIEPNGFAEVTVIEGAAGETEGTARFSTGLDSVNHLDEHGAVSVPVVTVDSVVGDRTVTGMKVDVEGYEIEVLRGAERALGDRRITLLQLEWNEASVEAVGSDRAPVAALLASHGYALFRPDRSGRLLPTPPEPSVGADVFAAPAH